MENFTVDITNISPFGITKIQSALKKTSKSILVLIKEIILQLDKYYGQENAQLLMVRQSESEDKIVGAACLHKSLVELNLVFYFAVEDQPDMYASVISTIFASLLDIRKNDNGSLFNSFILPWLDDGLIEPPSGDLIPRANTSIPDGKLLWLDVTRASLVEWLRDFNHPPKGQSVH